MEWVPGQKTASVREVCALGSRGRQVMLSGGVLGAPENQISISPYVTMRVSALTPEASQQALRNCSSRHQVSKSDHVRAAKLRDQSAC